jgi:hypothetical protein
MSAPHVDTPILAEPGDPRTVPAQGANGAPVDAAAEESDLDELLNYQPVPPRRAVTLSVQYRHLGRGRPLPYSLKDDEE